MTKTKALSDIAHYVSLAVNCGSMASQSISNSGYDLMSRARDLIADLGGTSKFLVRIELEGGASEAEYTALHKVLAKEGFSKDLETEVRTKPLPPATYIIERSGTANAVRDETIMLVKQVWTSGHKIVAGKCTEIAST